ncbi:MAG TPA: GNAT family N-acetyltransferase [Chloroflexota bacterium]|nr:GNAT family N-acetyltransferase [Chloroflexota bacterium]
MFNIRRATPEDVEALVHLRLALLREAQDLTDNTPVAALAHATRQYLAEKIPTDEFIAWVAEVHGIIVGTSGLVFVHRPPSAQNLSGMEAYVMNMYTAPAWRGQGVATALLKEVMGFVKGTSAWRIYLHATTDGKRIYEKAGFVAKTSEMELMLVAGASSTAL